MPDIGPADRVHPGPLLRQIREAVGRLASRLIAERSKIGMAYLHALESEVFAKLPAAVYVREASLRVRASALRTSAPGAREADVPRALASGTWAVAIGHEVSDDDEAAKP